MDSIDSLIFALEKKLPANHKGEDFYSFIVRELDIFRKDIDIISQKDFDSFLIKSNVMVGSPTKRRFLNLIDSIIKYCIIILQYAYKGDLYQALNMLNKLLYKGKYTQYKLSEEFVKHFLAIDDNTDLYRCIDYDIGETPNNCWHVPFELRYKASKNRFNQLGYPCLYLANSFDCAYRECGDVKKNKRRWYGKFRKKDDIFYLDLSLPKIEEMNSYEKFSFLITFPLRLLCLTKVEHENEPFSDEYLFSQLFFHLLFLHKDDCKPRFDGIRYISTKVPTNLCYVIPAYSDSNIPQTKGISQYILSHFEEICSPKETC